MMLLLPYLPDLPASTWLALLVAVLWGLAAATLATFGLRAARRARVQSRLRDLHLADEASQPLVRARRPGLRHLVRQVGEQVVRRWPAEGERRRVALDAAGLGGRCTPAELIGWKVLLVAGGALIGLAAVLQGGQTGLIVLVGLGILGWALPDGWVSRQRRARQRQILRDLPTVIDLLALSLEAGMGLERALRVVSERMPSPLTEELQRVLTDTSLGINRQEAFLRMGSRVGLDEVQILATRFAQSIQLGTSLVVTVQTQAHQLRASRRRQAEAQALKAPTKMVLPMVLFILPVLFLVVLGPAALQMSQAIMGAHP